MKHNVEIEGLPEGWEVTEMVIHPDDSNDYPEWKQATVKIQKTKPRRIVLEETEEDAKTTHFIKYGNVFLHIESDKIWRMVVEQHDKTIKEE